MQMGRAFANAVERTPGRTAVVDPDAGRRYTYAEWADRAASLADGLAGSGLAAGDRVGAIAQNRVELATLYWACQSLGAVFTPFNFRAAADELAFLLGNTTPAALFFGDVAVDAVRGALADVEGIDPIVALDDPPGFATPYAASLEAGEGEAYGVPDIDEDATSVLLHTSGTTGRPKGVPRSNRNTHAACEAQAVLGGWAVGETILGLMPLYHTMGIRAIATMPLLNGTWVAQRRFTPGGTLSRVEDEGIEILSLVPTVFHDLVEFEAIEDHDVSSVTKVMYAGTPMTERVEREVRETFRPDVFVNYYGCTEIYSMSVCSWLDETPGSAGKAAYNTRVRVVTPADATVPPDETLDPGELGEVIVDATSPEASDGYLDRPDADAEAFRGDWYFTGDLGYRDGDGDLFVVGRVDDMIISGGENIQPVEVEDALDVHPDVREIAVVGRDHERWNQVVTAFVRTDRDDYEPLAAELDDFLRVGDRLADFKRPRRYVFAAEIPKSRVGKILRRELVGDVDVPVLATVDV